MVDITPQATQLNDAIKAQNNSMFDILSNRGKAIYFPKKGIVAQTSDAKGKKYDATIGIALEEDLSPMRLKPISKLLKKFNPKDIFLYASSFGKDKLRKKWKKGIYDKNESLKSEISTPVCCSGLTHAMMVAGYLFVNPKDKIIISDKYWENCSLIFENTFGAKLDSYNTFSEENLDLDSLKSKLVDSAVGKKILLLNYPNNPTGYSPTDEEAIELIEIIKSAAQAGNKIVVIIDDAYFGLVYQDGIIRESFFSKLANISKNVIAVKIDGATKENYAWGFRVGFLTFGIKEGNDKLYAALENKAAGAIRATISNASNLSQEIVYKEITAKQYDKEKKKKFEILRRRHLEVINILKNEKYSKFFKPLPFNSGYFMCLQLRDGVDAEKVRQILLTKYSTGVIALGNLLRVTYASARTKDLKQIFENIYSACSEIK